MDENKDKDVQGESRGSAIVAGFGAVPAAIATGYIWPAAASIAVVIVALVLLALVVGFRLPGR